MVGWGFRSIDKKIFDTFDPDQKRELLDFYFEKIIKVLQDETVVFDDSDYDFDLSIEYYVNLAFFHPTFFYTQHELEKYSIIVQDIVAKRKQKSNLNPYYLLAIGVSIGIFTFLKI